MNREGLRIGREDVRNDGHIHETSKSRRTNNKHLCETNKRQTDQEQRLENRINAQQSCDRQEHLRIRILGYGDHPRSRVDALAPCAQEQEQRQEGGKSKSRSKTTSKNFRVPFRPCASVAAVSIRLYCFYDYCAITTVISEKLTQHF